MTAKRTPALDTKGTSNPPRLYDNQALAALILPLEGEVTVCSGQASYDYALVKNRLADSVINSRILSRIYVLYLG